MLMVGMDGWKGVLLFTCTRTICCEATERHGGRSMVSEQKKGEFENGGYEMPISQDAFQPTTISLLTVYIEIISSIAVLDRFDNVNIFSDTSAVKARLVAWPWASSITTSVALS